MNSIFASFFINLIISYLFLIFLDKLYSFYGLLLVYLWWFDIFFWLFGYCVCFFLSIQVHFKQKLNFFKKKTSIFAQNIRFILIFFFWILFYELFFMYLYVSNNYNNNMLRMFLFYYNKDYIFFHHSFFSCNFILCL